MSARCVVCDAAEPVPHLAVRRDGDASLAADTKAFLPAEVVTRVDRVVERLGRVS